KDANLYLNEKQTNSEVIELFQEKLVNLSEVLGISLDDATPELLHEEIDRLIVERDDARAANNFERADEIRDLLQEKEIILEDTPHDVIYKRIYIIVFVKQIKRLALVFISAVIF